MRPLFFRLLIPVVASCLFFLPVSCSTEVDINAQPQDIWSVYGVLNPQDTMQEVRIAMGFLPESDAEVAALENDFSLKGLRVVLTGDGKEWVATQIDSVEKDPGTFFPYTSIYRFDTQGANALTPGQRYDLEITRADDPELLLRSHTFVPNDIVFSSPTITPGPGGQRCLRQISLDTEYKVTFDKAGAVGFELRAFLDYEENGIPKQADYGPTAMFTDGVRCKADGNTMCYQFRAKEIIQSFYQDINPQPTNVYTYGVTEATRCNDIPANLPDVFRFEVTAVDTAIAQYRLANDPKFVDFNTVRPEFTNIEGAGITVGVFGSINVATASGQFNECTAYLLQLNGTKKPSSPCEL